MFRALSNRIGGKSTIMKRASKLLLIVLVSLLAPKSLMMSPMLEDLTQNDAEEGGHRSALDVFADVLVLLLECLEMALQIVVQSHHQQDDYDGDAHIFRFLVSSPYLLLGALDHSLALGGGHPGGKSQKREIAQA